MERDSGGWWSSQAGLSDAVRILWMVLQTTIIFEYVLLSNPLAQHVELTVGLCNHFVGLLC